MNTYMNKTIVSLDNFVVVTRSIKFNLIFFATSIEPDYMSFTVHSAIKSNAN